MFSMTERNTFSSLSLNLSDKSLTRKLVNWKAFSAVRKWLLSTGGQKNVGIRPYQEKISITIASKEIKQNIVLVTR